MFVVNVLIFWFELFLLVRGGEMDIWDIVIDFGLDCVVWNFVEFFEWMNVFCIEVWLNKIILMKMFLSSWDCVEYVIRSFIFFLDC